jgi:hypothetical protein
MLTKEQIQAKYGPEYNLITNPRADLYVKYTQEGLRGSAELNMALIEYFYSGLPFYNDDLRRKAFEINNGFFKDGQIFKANKELTVYHGTNYNLHDPKSDFTTYAFFSTTIASEIAETYGKIIYKIKIPVGYPIINLYDQSNMQILLPIGTNINNIELDTMTSNKVTYKCEINNTNIENIITTINQLLKPNIKPIDISIKPDNILESEIKDISDFNSVKPTNKLKASSTIYSCYFNNQSYGKTSTKNQPDNYIIKDILKKKDFTKCFKTDDYICRRIMNEILASLVYQEYGLQTFDYDLVYNDRYQNRPKYMLGSDKINNIQYIPDSSKATELLKGFIVDCILSNWDAYNNNNIGLLDNKSIRTDVGGALAYRGIGDFKLSFFNNLEPKEHITFIRENPNIRILLKKIIQLNQPNINTQPFEFMYEILDNFKSININILDLVNNPKIKLFMPYYGDFIEKILNTVSARHDKYINNKNKVIKEIINTLKDFDITQSGGSKQFIIYLGKVRKVYTTNKMRYIILNKTKVSLKEIKGKYKYQKQLGGSPEECPTFENIAGNDLDLSVQGIPEELKLETLLKKLKDKTNSNTRTKN